MQTSNNPITQMDLTHFSQIEVKIDPDYGIVWIYQKPYPRPCFNPILIQEVRSVQLMLDHFQGQLPHKGELVPIHYHVLDSNSPGLFSLGGDLNLFREHIIRKDKEGLLRYARACIDTIHAIHTGFRKPITTISLVRGDALGGGFEVAMAANVIIAEEQVEMGFPEIMFNLFPGMGGYHFLCQRLPMHQVEKMMLNNKRYSATELSEKGVIDVLAKPDQGDEAVYQYVKDSSHLRNGHLAMKKVREMVNPITHQELMEVCEYWVETALNIDERNLKMMQRLVSAQNRRYGTDTGIEAPNVVSLSQSN